jgi:hypothetical protein
MTDEILGPNCHCGRYGHPMGSINCPVHGDKPRITIAEDKNRLKFEAYELRRENGSGSIFIDRALVESLPGGIEAIRNAIAPHFLIVCERLK